MEMASRRIEVLKTSPDLADHVRIIMGYDDELALLSSADPESAKRAAEIEASVEAHVQRIQDLPRRGQAAGKHPPSARGDWPAYRA